jgi:hypothetical protein
MCNGRSLGEMAHGPYNMIICVYIYISRQQYLHHNPHVHKRVYGVCMTHGLEITKQRETNNRTISYDVLRNDYKCTESIFKIVYIYGLCICIYINILCA